MVVRARWSGLDSSVVEHLTSDAGLPGSIPGPATYFHLYFFVFVHSSYPYYNLFHFPAGVPKDLGHNLMDKNCLYDGYHRNFYYM